MTDIYIDGRQFLHYIEGDVNYKVPARVIGQCLEFKVKDRAIADRLGRDVVLVPLTDLLALTEKVDKSG